MKEHMPSPASLSDEELVRQASDAVYSLAYEPENIALIRAAGKFGPSLADYAAFKELRTPDTGYNRKNAALKCLADVARNRFGEDAFVTVHCLFNQIQNLLDTDQEASFLLIKKCCVLQEKITTHSPTNRNKEALYLYQLYSMYLSNLLTGDNPLFFKELFRIEKEVLALYEGWEENTLSKADIYSIIGCLKNATLYTAISNDLFWEMFPNGNKMVAYNENNDYVSNAFSYLSEALDIRRQLLNPYHPDLSYDKSNLYYFLIQRSHLLTETENTRDNTVLQLLQTLFPCRIASFHFVPHAFMGIESSFWRRYQRNRLLPKHETGTKEYVRRVGTELSPFSVSALLSTRPDRHQRRLPPG